MQTGQAITDDAYRPTCLHWRDTESGWVVRIANLLATVAAHVGRCLQPGQDGCVGLGIKRRPLTSLEFAGISSIRLGWEQQSQAVQAAGTRIEQEFQSLVLPSAARPSGTNH